MKVKVYIHRLHFPLDGIYNYSAQKWFSLDGETYSYTGYGKYFRTLEEAETCKEENEK